MISISYTIAPLGRLDLRKHPESDLSPKPRAEGRAHASACLDTEANRCNRSFRPCPWLTAEHLVTTNLVMIRHPNSSVDLARRRGSEMVAQRDAELPDVVEVVVSVLAVG